MSPLTCSLFALAALFAVTAADDDNSDPPFCGSLMQGEEDYDYIRFSLVTSGDTVLQIPDRCDGPKRKQVGQLVSACDAPNYAPQIIGFTDIKNIFSKVKVNCPKEYVGCSNLVVNIIQYCRNYNARRSS